MQAQPVPIDERRAIFDAAAPPGFLYPESFQRVIAGELPDILPIWWLVQFRGSVEWWSDTVRNQYPSRSLVPFAKQEATDDVYCFDTSGTDSEPLVLQIHTFASPGWEYRGEWLSFDSFLRAADEAHQEWLLDQQEPDV
ncbi:hypothetical protein [Mesorhizobium japonicum]|uniref:hypothetical protein n=1 Tax=Mesorhizobium japonicum TaxID=2066070 RepID=UPI003B592FB0